MSRRRGPVADSYWVVPGRFLAGSYPGSRDPATAREKLATVVGAGIDLFVDLTEPGELPPYDSELARADSRVQYRRFPVRDLDCPRPETMREILDAIDEAIDAGRKVYLHCWGGIGRTGTVVGCYLIRHGTTPAEALAALADWRRDTPSGYRVAPEMPAQREMIERWSEQEP